MIGYILAGLFAGLGILWLGFKAAPPVLDWIARKLDERA